MVSEKTIQHSSMYSDTGNYIQHYHEKRCASAIFLGIKQAFDRVWINKSTTRTTQIFNTSRPFLEINPSKTTVIPQLQL